MHWNFGEKDEILLVEGFAKLIREKGNVSGDLILTNKRIIFYSYAEELLEISLLSITNMAIVKTLQWWQKGLTISTGNEYFRFIVEYAEDWQKVIESQIHITLGRD